MPSHSLLLLLCGNILLKQRGRCVPLVMPDIVRRRLLKVQLGLAASRIRVLAGLPCECLHSMRALISRSFVQAQTVRQILGSGAGGQQRRK